MRAWRRLAPSGVLVTLIHSPGKDRNVFGAGGGSGHGSPILRDPPAERESVYAGQFGRRQRAVLYASGGKTATMLITKHLVRTAAVEDGRRALAHDRYDCSCIRAILAALTSAFGSRILPPTFTCKSEAAVI